MDIKTRGYKITPIHFPPPQNVIYFRAHVFLNMSDKRSVSKKREIIAAFKNRFFPGSKRYWEERYREGRDSGVGSYGKIAEFKAEVINDFVEKNDVRSAIEFGCGDGNQLSLFDIPKYVGLDISDKAVELCRERFQHNDSKRFYKYEPENFDSSSPVFKAELTLSLDVIFHIIEDDIYELYMEHLFSCAERFVVIYSDDTNTKQMYHVKRRKFTRWIGENADGWKLIQRIENRYPDISLSEFHIYHRSSRDR